MSRPLNRSERRSWERIARRVFRESGCRCRAIYTSRDPRQFGVVFAADVEHEEWCPLTLAASPITDAGLTPVLIRSSVTPRCER